MLLISSQARHGATVALHALVVLAAAARSASLHLGECAHSDLTAPRGD